MAMGRVEREAQSEFWVATQDLPRSPGHVFYEELNGVLDKAGFDDFCETQCKKFYADVMGRPSVAPGVYFRMLIVGYFEKLDSERQIAWRCRDSLSLREFLRLGVDGDVPDHSSLSRTRHRIDLDTHRMIFEWVLRRLREHDLLSGKTVGVDSSTIEANAAMRSIVRKDNGESYQEFLTNLAKESGIETPTAQDLAKLDRKRQGKKVSNKEWYNPHDPDAKIAKMKDGTTHLGYKPEHAVDLQTGAIVAAEIHPADQGDTGTVMTTLAKASENLLEASTHSPETETKTSEHSPEASTPPGAAGEATNTEVPTTAPEAKPNLAVLTIEEAVLDKGYHSGETLVELETVEVRGYVSEPDRGPRNWTAKNPEEQAAKRKEQQATYRNRRRAKGERSKQLHRKRGEFVERAFEHVLDDGGMRRAHLKGRENVHKRYLIHVAAFNLGLIMRQLLGFGTPKGWADALRALGMVWKRFQRLARPCFRSRLIPFPSPTPLRPALRPRSLAA
jgi:transposase